MSRIPSPRMQPSCEYHYQLRVKQPPSVRYKGSNPSEPLLAKQPTKVPAEDRPAIAKERAALAIARLRHTLTAFVAVTFASSCSPDQQQGEDDVMVVDIEAQSEADLRQAYEEVVRVTESEILDYRAVLSPDALLLGTANDEQESEEEAEIIIKDAELVTIEATRESLLWTTLAKHAATPHHRLLKLDPTILGNALRSVEGCFEECGVLLSVLNPIVRPDERVLLMVEGSSRSARRFPSPSRSRRASNCRLHLHSTPILPSGDAQDWQPFVGSIASSADCRFADLSSTATMLIVLPTRSSSFSMPCCPPLLPHALQPPFLDSPSKTDTSSTSTRLPVSRRQWQ